MMVSTRIQLAVPRVRVPPRRKSNGKTTMTQFKEHEIERPDFLGESWNDSSWRNDACAHAKLFLTPDESGTGPVVEFWVNYRDPKSRGIEPRFMVVYQRSYAVESGVDSLLWKGEDEGEARSWARAAEIAKTIIAEILAHPDLLAARTFSELHDHCDANCLGEQEAFLDSCGWTGEDEAKDQEALNASTDVLNGAQGRVVGLSPEILIPVPPEPAALL